MIPKIAIDIAKRKGVTTKWLTEKGRETLNAIDQFKMIQAKFKAGDSTDTESPPLSIVALPAGQMILAVGRRHIDKDSNPTPKEEQKDETNFLVIQKQPKPFRDEQPIVTPFASVLFGALIAIDLNHRNFSDPTPQDYLDVDICLKKAFEFTKKYVEHENARVTQPEKWEPKEKKKSYELLQKENRYVTLEKVDQLLEECKDNETELKSKLKELKKAAKVVPGKYSGTWNQDLNLKEADARWNMATKDLGIISYTPQSNTSEGEKPRSKPQYKLELFRASIEVENYICLDQLKKTPYKTWC